MTRIVFAILLLLMSTMPPASADSPNMDAATGYRIANYRAPVTLPPEGGTRVDLPAVDQLIKQRAVLIDVMPARAGYDQKTGKWLLVEKREDIPGSIWLPDTGRGVLEPRLAAYLSNELKRLTGGKLDRPIVFYCMADCWMSWNAVKRAARASVTRDYIGSPRARTAGPRPGVSLSRPSRRSCRRCPKVGGNGVSSFRVV